MAENFYYALQKIHNDYDDQAFKIWSNNPKSATVVRRFLGFKGVGLKIANMAANMLVRDFNIPMKDYNSIDISVDTHIRRLFKRLGFVNENANVKTFFLDKKINCKPGQFFMVWLPGVDEIPMSIGWVEADEFRIGVFKAGDERNRKPSQYPGHSRRGSRNPV